MKFQHESFSCDVDVFSKGLTLSVRFYDKSRIPKEEELGGCVIVDPGYGYLWLKYQKEKPEFQRLKEELHGFLMGIPEEQEEGDIQRLKEDDLQRLKGNIYGFLGGFLDEEIFSSDELVAAAIEFTSGLSPLLSGAYIFSHVDRVKKQAIWNTMVSIEPGLERPRPLTVESQGPVVS